jgi:hypothetical protein
MRSRFDYSAGKHGDCYLYALQTLWFPSPELEHDDYGAVGSPFSRQHISPPTERAIKRHLPTMRNGA